VKQGDTLSGTAQGHDDSLAAGEQSNPQITNRNLIYPGGNDDPGKTGGGNAPSTGKTDGNDGPGQTGGKHAPSTNKTGIPFVFEHVLSNPLARAGVYFIYWSVSLWFLAEVFVFMPRRLVRESRQALILTPDGLIPTMSTARCYEPLIIGASTSSGSRSSKMANHPMSFASSRRSMARPGDGRFRRTSKQKMRRLGRA